MSEGIPHERRRMRDHRWSDEELSQFHSEFREHKNEFNEHEKKERAMSIELLECQGDLKATVDELTTIVRENQEQIKALTESTAGIAEAWSAAQGTVKVGSALGKFAKWIGSVAILGWVFAKIVEHSDKVPK